MKDQKKLLIDADEVQSELVCLGKNASPSGIKIYPVLPKNDISQVDSPEIRHGALQSIEKTLHKSEEHPAIEQAFNFVKATILFSPEGNQGDHHETAKGIQPGLHKSATSPSILSFLSPEPQRVKGAIGSALFGIAGPPILHISPTIEVTQSEDAETPAESGSRVDPLPKSASTSCLSTLSVDDLDTSLKEVVHLRDPDEVPEFDNYEKSEDLLKDALFSLVTLLGPDKKSTWVVSSAGADTEGQKMTSPSVYTLPRDVTLEQAMSHLENVFQVSDQKMQEILIEIKSRQIPDIYLNLRIEEANELRPKTVKGGTNPYVSIQMSSCPHSHRTRSEHETLRPKWKQDFKLKIIDLRKDILTLEVMHEYDHVGREDLKDIHDLGGVTRLISMTNAKALKQEVKLLGKASIPISEILDKGFDNWVPLQKENAKDELKPRGNLHIKAFIGAASTHDSSQNETRKNFDRLLTNFIYHQMNLAKMESVEANLELPYSGQLSAEALAILSQHSVILNLSKSSQALSWWLVGSHLPSADMGWQLILLNKVQCFLAQGLYSKEEMEVLADSFASWSRLCVHKLRNLQTSFPASSGVIARHQLTSLLQIATTLETNLSTKKLLLQRGLSDLNGKIKETVLEHVEIWWKSLTNFRGSVDLESQMKKMISFLFETEIFFKTVAGFYSPVFLKEGKIPFFREVFLMISKGIRECVLPLLKNIDLKYSGPLENHREEALDISVGPDLWQIYVNLRRINSFGAELPSAVLEQSGLFQYHKWFEKGVLRWIELSKRKTHTMLCKAVEFDVFQPDDEYHNFSSSASDTIGIFHEVQIWWKRLEWPDEVNSGIFLAKILQDVCACGTTYSELIKAKVDAAYNASHRRYQHEDHIISEQTCIGLNNIEKVRQELMYLPESFGVDELARRIEASPTGGEKASQTFRNNIKEVIEDSSSNMERKVTEFIDTVIEKRKERLQLLVFRSFEEGNERPLLNEVLDPSLQLLQQKLDKSNFKRLLSGLWDELVHIFEMTIARNSEEKRSSYFEVVYNIIEATLKFFTPSNGVGLEREEAKTQSYIGMMEHLELRRLPSEKLIEQYYHERFLEHSQPFNQQRAELVVKAYFTRIGKLKVAIIMAKDMILSNSEGESVSSKQGSPSATQTVDSYVKMHLVPSAWFRDNGERKTKVSRKSDPAVYDEEFEFELSNTDNGVSSGFLLLTLKDYSLARNKFIGEGIIPLRDLECVDSADVGTVSLIRLKMTSPGLEIGYKPLAILKLRTNDNIAKAFVKKVAKRMPDGRKKSGFLTASSDEERPRNKSPGLIPRRKIS